MLRAFATSAAARYVFTFIIVGLSAGLFVGVASADVFPVSPRATYLRTNSDTPDLPTIVDLSAVRDVGGPGDGGGPRLLSITALGDFAPGNLFPDTHMAMISVFSAGTQVLGTSLPARLPGAVEGGLDFISGPSYYGNLPTDIPQDFAVSFDVNQRTVLVEVPLGATHLMVGMMDSYFGDNRDPDSDLAVAVNWVPEPTSSVLLGLAALGLVRGARGRRQGASLAATDLISEK